jgi:hypothetical protein
MSLTRRVVEHWPLKLLSVVFAVAVWAVVASEDKTEAVYTVPLDVVGLPPGLQVATLGVETVEVRVQGLRHVLARLPEQNLRVEVNLASARPGEISFPIRPEDVVAPRGVQVVRVIPPRVRATIGPAGRPAPRPAA